MSAAILFALGVLLALAWAVWAMGGGPCRCDECAGLGAEAAT